MKTFQMSELSDTKVLQRETQSSEDPVVVFDGEDECLVAMSPAVFERILYDNDALSALGHTSLCF